MAVQTPIFFQNGHVVSNPVYFFGVYRKPEVWASFWFGETYLYSALLCAPIDMMVCRLSIGAMMTTSHGKNY